VTVYSLDGKTVINEVLQDRKKTIDISALEQGLYIVEAENSKGIIRKNLVKQ